MRNKLAALALSSVLGSLSLTACDLDVPDLNNPSLSDLEDNPDAVTIGAAATGLLVGNRRNHAAANGYVAQLGILGREAYSFDAADPRYVNELLVGSLSRGSPFGGNFWGAPYSNIRLGNILLHALDKVSTSQVSEADKTALRGFVKTIQALDLLEVVVTHDTNGAVIDTDRDPLGALAPLVGPDQSYPKIVELLDSGYADLNVADGAFAFQFSKGFDGFDTPTTFAKFNRAIRARVAVYLEDYATALTALNNSFINDDPVTVNFDLGVYYAYSTKPGDTSNALINPNIYVHPSLEADAIKDSNDVVVDNRFNRKTREASTPGRRGTTRNFKGLYPNPESSVSLIRNEELILLKAEALYSTDPVQALAELNLVRTRSGLLPAIAAPADRDAFITALLYERRYSLLFEGHRWIDARRLDHLADLPLFVTTRSDGTMVTDKLNVRYPIPSGECNARPDEPKCMLGSN